MAETSRIADINTMPQGERVIETDIIRHSLLSKDVGIVAIGSGDRTQRELRLDENGIAYVDMNKSGRLNLASGERGLIVTSNLAGCTGVAGFAKRKDGSTAQFVSHYDAISQTSHFTHEDSPINSQMYGLRHDTTSQGELEGAVRMLVAYPESVRANPNYGLRSGSFNEWTYLEQIEMTASQLGSDTEVLFLPYKNGDGNSLASGRTDQSEGIYWNGVLIDFADYIKP
jgi:hypothetical protein